MTFQEVAKIIGDVADEVPHVSVEGFQGSGRSGRCHQKRYVKSHIAVRVGG